MLRLGFIGGGNNSAGGATHFIAAQMDARFRVQAGCFSRHAEVNQETAARWGIPAERTYAHFEQMLQAERGQLDAIAVLVPTPQHAEPVIAALRLGYAVICEKALAASLSDAERIAQAQSQTRGFLALTYNYSGYPMLRELRSQIAAGHLGRIRQVQAEMPQEGFLRRDAHGQPITPQPWRLQDGAIPTVSLDLGVHLHHLVTFLTGEQPLRIVCRQSSLGHFAQIADTVQCLVCYSGGMECGLWYGKGALGHANGLLLRVYGERGSAYWQQTQPESLHLQDERGGKRVLERSSADCLIAQAPRYSRFKPGHPDGFLEAFANLYSDIADALQGFRASGELQSPFVFSTDHALEGLRLLHAAALSAREERWVQIAEAQT